MHSLGYQQLERLPVAWGWLLCGLVLLAMSLCAASVAQPGSGIVMELVLTPSRAEADADVVMSVVARNSSEEGVSFQPPTREDISVTVTGPDDGAYMVVWQTAGERGAESRSVWLQPHCAFEAIVGTMRLAKAPGGKPGVPPGLYTVTAEWQAPASVGEGHSSLSATANMEVIASPLVVSLPPVTVARYGAGPILLRVKLANSAAYPIVLMNYFLPYKEHFEVRLAAHVASEGSEGLDDKSGDLGRLMLPAITPHAGKGWVTLLPGEAIWVDMDVTDAVAQPGVYDATLVYRRRVLLRPPDRDPYYSHAARWVANEAQLVVLEAPTEPAAGQ